MFCLEPLLLAGYLLTLQPNHYHSTNMNGPIIEVQTCERGLGAHAKASTSGLYTTGVQYGLSAVSGQYSLTFQPFVGVSYVDRPVRELPQRGQFECGVKLLAGVNNMRIGIEYLHISNAGMEQPNIGLDLISIQWVF